MLKKGPNYTSYISYFISYIYNMDIVVIVSWSKCFGSLFIYWTIQYKTCFLRLFSLNPVHGEVCSIQHYVIKFVSDLRQAWDLLRVLQLPPSIKLTAKILLKYCSKWRYISQALEFRTPLFPHLGPPAIMVWILVWKYIFEPFIHILQHFVLKLFRSTNFCF